MYRLLFILMLIGLTSAATLTVSETSTQILNPGTNIIFSGVSGSAPGVSHSTPGSVITFTTAGTYSITFTIGSTTPTFYTLCVNGALLIPLYSLTESPIGTVQTNLVITDVPSYMTFQNIYTSPVVITAGSPGVKVDITI